jgi:hypothetical protein
MGSFVSSLMPLNQQTSLRNDSNSVNTNELNSTVPIMITSTVEYSNTNNNGQQSTMRRGTTPQSNTTITTTTPPSNLARRTFLFIDDILKRHRGIKDNNDFIKCSFANHFYMAGRRFKNTMTQSAPAFLFGDISDLGFILSHKPVVVSFTSITSKM